MAVLWNRSSNATIHCIRLPVSIHQDNYSNNLPIYVLTCGQHTSEKVTTSHICSLHVFISCVAIGTAYWRLEHVSVMVLFQTYWWGVCLLFTTAVTQCGGGCSVLRSTSPW